MDNQAKERLRITLSLRFTQRVRRLICEYRGADGTPPQDNPQYLEALRSEVTRYDQETRLLIGGAG